MMASARDMRYHLKSVMEAVERGEEVLVSKRGVVKARILPVRTESKTPAGENPFVGLWKDREDLKDVRRHVRRLRRGRFG